MHRQLRRFAAAPLCLCALALFVAAAGAGDIAPGQTPGMQPGQSDPAVLERERARIRAEMSALNRRVADAYIAEQTDRGLRDRVTLIVGALYETGNMGEPDPVLAAQYYAQAALTETGDGLPEATAALANMYNAGAKSASGSIPRDPARARQLYETAAAAGSVPAMLALGIMYADGMNVDPDPEKALGYFLQAAERGDATAFDRLLPVMNRAREWEEARPGRKGRAGFPTTPEELRKPELVQAFIDRTFDLDRFASHVFVELNRRIKAADPGVR